MSTNNFPRLMAKMLELSSEILTKQDYTKELVTRQFDWTLQAFGYETITLQREKFAVKELQNALHKNIEWKITLVYIFEGEHYCVLSANVPGCKRTKELHDRKIPLTSEQWDNMKKIWVWVETGAFYSDVNI